MMLAPMNPTEIIARTARDVHPPLHYLVLHYWMKLFGTSEAAARSLSVILVLATIVIIYLLVKRLFDTKAANLAAIFMAIGPFLVRYSQEARMYALAAFLLAAATLALVLVQESKRTRFWALYVVLMAAGFYTHYYTVFIVVAHWLYMLFASHKKSASGLYNPKWWIANVGIVLIFAPWIPFAYAQFTRVQAAFWIPPVGPNTLPATLAQFLTFTSLDSWPLALRLGGALAFLAIVGLAILNYKQKLSVLLLSFYLFTGPVLVFVLSLRRPIYVDRYFVFAAVAFYALVAVILAMPWLNRRRYLQSVLVAAFIGIFSYGISNVYHQANHQMRQIATIVNAQLMPGDEIISGELYTFFDFSHYNRSGQQLRLLAPDGVSGYGESSLIYDRAEQIVVRSLSELRPTSGVVWVIGKTGDKDYFTDIPPYWRPVGPRYEAGYSAAQKYQLLAPRQQTAAGF